MLPLPRASRVVVLVTLGLSWAAPAGADVALPNGTVIPLGPNLSGYLNGSPNNDGINEGIDVVHDAAVVPESFSPLCDFGGKYIAKGGSANFAVGWYNVDDARPDAMPPAYVPTDLGANLNVPAPGSDVQILFPFASVLPPPGQVTLTAVSIRQSPAYLGGLIGFVLVPNPNGTGSANATEYHFTEHRFNVNCTQCASPGPWYSDLIYRSNMLPNTFYLGFEDLDFVDAPGAQGVNGNDLDYEDFLFRFSGIACAAAGQPCTVDANVGACRAGITDCDAQGQTICTAIIAPGSVSETCNGVDDDCNGQTDDGAVCPGAQLCVRGRCVDPCDSGEFKCDTGLTCDQGVCIEASCVGKDCPTGKVCHDGQCTEPCEGVTCPAGQVCRADRCQDPCEGITCADNLVCVDGVCVTGCNCRPCATGDSCDGPSGQCVETACLGVTCGASEICKAGACVDRCAGAVCPGGATCMNGACQDSSSTTSSTGASSGVTFPVGSTTVGPGAGGGPPTSSAAGTGGAFGDSGDFNADSGCGCRTAGDGAPPPLGVAIAAASVAALALARRRRSVRVS